MEKEVEQKLWEAPTLADMLNVLINSYRLNEVRPGVAVRTLLIVGLKKAINMVKPIRK